jgi:gliding motility-associated protein GldM
LQNIVSELGTWSSGDKKFYLRAKSINNFKDQNDLSRQIDKMFRISKINPDELDDLREIYSDLSLQERVNAGEIKDVHWIGRTFDHSPLVAALASLTSLEQSVLSARADAISMLKERAGTGEYSFNKVMALSYGPAFVNQNEDYEVKVLMAAYDSDNNPIVTGASETKDGVAYIRGKASGSEVNLSGTISIRKKDGSMKTQSWQNKIVVMKPQGTISLPQMNILYKGYENIIEGVASGYDQTILTGSNVTLVKKGNQWVAKPANVKTSSISISGKSSATGKTVKLGTYNFTVRQLPKPDLYLGNVASGDAFVPGSSTLFAKLDPSNPLNVKYDVISYELTTPIAPMPKKGSGNVLNADALSLLRQLKPGAYITIMTQVRFPNGDVKRVAGTFRR